MNSLLHLFTRFVISPWIDHLNYLCKDSEIGPIALSLLYEDKKFTALLRTCEANRRVFLKEEEIPKSWWRKLVGLGPSTTEVFTAISAHLPTDKLKMVMDPSVVQALLTVDEKQASPKNERKNQEIFMLNRSFFF